MCARDQCCFYLPHSQHYQSHVAEKGVAFGKESVICDTALQIAYLALPSTISVLEMTVALVRNGAAGAN